VIDRSLNYGREIIESYLKDIGYYKKILDIGAGNGEDLATAERIDSAVDRYAIENYEEYARSLEQQGVTVFRNDIERDELPFSFEELDVVMANQILEHTKDVFWIFHEVSRVLKTGGYFIVGVPNLAAFHNRLLLLVGKQPTQIKNASAHIRGYTKNDLIDFVTKCWPGGYELIAFKGSNFYPFPPALARPMASCFPSMAWGIFLLLRKTKEYNAEFIEYPLKEELETRFYLGKT
jgi:SAM-dependent methyltransferase